MGCWLSFPPSQVLFSLQLETRDMILERASRPAVTEFSDCLAGAVSRRTELD